MTQFRFKHVITFISFSLVLGYGILWMIYRQFTDLIPDSEIFILVLLYFLLLVLTAYVYSTKSLNSIHYYLGIRMVSNKYLILALLFSTFLWMVDYFYQTMLLQIDIKQVALNWTLSKKGANGPLVFISMVIFAPLIEEMIFRWVFFQTARQYFNLFWSTLLISMLFAAIHFSWVLFPSVFFASLLYVYLTVKANSIIPAILAHIINNFLTFVYYTGLLNSF